MKQKSVMKHQFSQVPSANIPRSVFNRSHAVKTTFDSGYLVPFYVDEALPGDTFNVNATLFARMATQLVPIMDNMVMETFYFAVPYRLVWDNFQRFMGEQTDPDDSTDYVIPKLTQTGEWVSNSIHDYLGLPVGIANLPEVSCLWHRAYNLIWNEWFRDQNLQDSAAFSRGDGPDSDLSYELRRRGKRHDYFTSCLPWPQKGPGVELPLGSSAPVVNDGSTFRLADDFSGTNSTQLIRSSGLSTDPEFDVPGTPTATMYFDSGLEVDLSNATAATINSLRQAFQIQKLLERDARGGTRYTEIIRSHFGTVSPDYRLQRPEYLGGGSTPININAVTQTSTGLEGFESNTPLATLGAYATGIGMNNGFNKSFTEHCLILGLVNVRADLTYQLGIPKMFSRSTRYDFYWPALAHLGEQAVLSKEIYCDGLPEDESVFGYQERYAEYRYYPSKITGLMRSYVSTGNQSLDVWHLSQVFDTRPVLGDEFIQENPPVDRVIATPDEPQFILDVYCNNKTARPMPTYSVPGLIDHF